MKLRRSRPEWSELVTAVIIREDDVWKVQIWVDCPLESGDSSAGLDELTARCDSRVAAGYPPGDERASAELQYAIYPAEVKGPTVVIMDITGGPGALVATDINGHDSQVRAATVEQLVAEGVASATDPDNVMFRWIKQVESL
jgi:hypothetical protein